MNVGLLDVIRPYFFVGQDLGPGVQNALTSLHVDEYDTAWDEDGVVIFGVARIDSDDPSSAFFSPQAGGGALASSQNGSSNDLVKWEWHDVAVRFRITIARRAGNALPLAQVNLPVSTVLAALGPDSGTAASDYPNTQFRMELMFDLVSVTFPKLIGARLDGWVLVPDPVNREVKISLPRVLLILTQDSSTTTDFDVKLGSFGAETLEDTDPRIANLLRMNPPYALIPGEQFGFGFKKAVLDLSDERTPPELLDRFGVGDDWQGIYLPEVRIFASTQRSAGVAFNIGAREMLIGLQPSLGLWGDFNIDVDILGDQLQVGLRLYGVSGARIDPTRIMGGSSTADMYQVTVPSTSGPETENYVLFVDISSGAAPFTITAVSGEEHPEDLSEIPDDTFFDHSEEAQDISVMQRMRLFSHDQRVAIRITSRNPGQRRVIVLDIYPDHHTSASTQPPEPEVPQAKLTTVTEGRPGTVRIDSQNDEEVVLRLTPPDGTLTVDGESVPVSGGQARFPAPAGSTQEVSAEWNTVGPEELERFTVFFRFNYPRNGEIGTVTTRGNLVELANTWNALPPGERTLRVDAYASREDGSDQAKYNLELSKRRADYLVSQLAAQGIPESEIIVGRWGNQSHPSSDSSINADLIADQVPGNASAEQVWNAYKSGQRGDYPSEDFRLATASLLRPTASSNIYRGTLNRDPVPTDDTPTERPQEPPAPQGQHPGWLRHIGGSVRFERDPIPVAYELRLIVDFKTAHEEGLEQFREEVNAIGPGLEEPDEQDRLPQGNPNPDDGVVEFRVALTYDPSTGTFNETLVARAADSDRDGLWSWGSIPAADAQGEPASDGWRDVLGLYFTLAPLLGETASDTAAGGEIVPLVIGLATPVAITVLGVAHVLRFTHYGVELDVRHDADEVHASLLFDVESALWLNLKLGNFVIVTNRPDKPVKVRYKAIGFALDAPPDQPVRFLPVFDSSRGYTIDLADSGSLRVLPSLGDRLGDIIQILGARIARTNPLNLEVELGMGVDLGVVSVDRFGFRLPIDPLGSPSITAISVGVNIPEVLTGRGYLKINNSGFQGQLDLTLVSVKMRVAGGLAVETVTEDNRSATSTIVTIAVEIPGGIPLGGTGLAIFGFLGLFAMHRTRLENTTVRNPALDWMVTRVAGDPTDLRGWGPRLDTWAFGVGLVAGTIEGGTVLNLKGMLVLELPGPRVLLLVKANILSPKPDTKGTDTGTLFAVVDISPQRVLIGIQFSYEIERNVLELSIPVEAGFFYDPPEFPPEHFYVDVGTIARPVTAKILQQIDATAYFMVHGNGIPDFPLGALQGFAIAAGFRASFTWGNTDVGLYLRISAGFDVGIGFKPLFFAGRVYIQGELRLFIVSIEAYAELAFRTDGRDTLIDGEVCGRVNFFFFSVKGCVGFSIGTDPNAPPVPDPIRDLMLQSRSPALVEGTGVDRGIDNVLCRGTDDGSVPTVVVREDNEEVLREVFVPIDTIPLLQFEVAPKLDPAATIDGQLSSGLPVGFLDGWQKRGENYLRYNIRSVELRLVAINDAAVPPGTPPVTDGPRPYTWRHPAQQAGSDGLPVELALIDWKPSNVDKALVQGPALDSLVDGRWKNTCTIVAEAARVMWTFRFEPLGPSLEGWRMDGQAWPDPPGSTRSLPVNRELRVRETWQTGTFLDGLLPAMNATVVGVGSQCPDRPQESISALIELVDRARLSQLAVPRLPAARRAPTTAATRSLNVSSGGVSFVDEPQECVAKVLQAPYELLSDSLSMIDDALQSTLKEMDEHRQGDLRDIVRLYGGPFIDMTLLIFARSEMVAQRLIKVRAYGPGGAEIAGVLASFLLVSSDAQLPPRWVDTSGPWWDDVKLARDYFPVLAKAGGWDQFLVRIKLPAPGLKIDIGISPLAEAIHEFGMNPPSFFLAVIEGLSLQEVIRVTADTEEAGDDLAGLEDALSGQPHALLLPNAKYEVIVRYDGQVGKKPDNPSEDEDPNEIVAIRTVTNQEARRTFFTDHEPPRSLDPWMLAQFPSPGEAYHFYAEPVVVVFSTDNVLELYNAYDRELRAVAHAASFRGSADTPEAPLTHLVLTGLFEPLGGAILSPWEATVRRRLGPKTCADFNPDADQHGRVTLPFALDPFTDYVLDLEMLDSNGHLATLSPLPNEVGVRPLYRQHFTTSRYATREAFAEAVRISLVQPRLVNDFTPLAALADRVTDEIFDLAMMDAGFEAASRPESPLVSVLWNTENPAQPLGILIETPEPLWRTRREPEAEYDETGEYIERWIMADHLWLSVDELVREDESVLVADGGEFRQRLTGTKTFVAQTIAEFRTVHIEPRPAAPPSLSPLPTALVDRLVRDGSGTRTLAILKAGGRGKTVTLGLARALHPLLDTDTSDTPVVLCEVDLAAPPWEDELP